MKIKLNGKDKKIFEELRLKGELFYARNKVYPDFVSPKEGNR